MLNTKMNNVDLKNELSINEADKKLTKIELDVQHKKFVNYVLNNKEEICSNCSPIVVRKKYNVRFKEFINKLKKVFGLEKRKEYYDGIEAYLQYSDDIE